MLNIPERLKNFRRQYKREIPPPAPCKGPDISWGLEMRTESGCCLHHLEELSCNFPITEGIEDDLMRHLELVYGIGPVTAAKLRENGIRTLAQLAADEKWQGKAKPLLHAIRGKNWEEIRKAGAHHYEILAFYQPEDFLFIDIETTGLYSTLPLFLVGILHRSDGKVILQQFLARDFQEEKPVLEAVRRYLEEKSVLVSYNGRTFDWPYLAGRYILHRIPVQHSPHHFDLLPAARKCFKGRFPDYRLKTVEAEILNAAREGDIPGELIPALYHEYVRNKNFQILKGIIDHNARDLLAMFYLMPHLVAQYQKMVRD